MNHIEKLKKLCLEPFYQCHVAGEIGPCVLESGCPENCFYTGGNNPAVTEKCQCERWKPVDPNPNIAAVLGPLAPELITLWEVVNEEKWNIVGAGRGIYDAVQCLNVKAEEVLK